LRTPESRPPQSSHAIVSRFKDPHPFSSTSVHQRPVVLETWSAEKLGKDGLTLLLIKNVGVSVCFLSVENKEGHRNCSSMLRVRSVVASPVCFVPTGSIRTIQHSLSATGLCMVAFGTIWESPCLR
jgi:hypothetical protein